MELWIRSQDREKLVKINNIEKQDHYTYKEVVENYMPPNATRYEDMQKRKVQKKDKYIKSVIMCNDEISLGAYNTEERALEVLDEIQNILKPQLLVRRNDDNDKVLLGALQKGVTQKLDMEFKELSTYVYEMPTD